MNDPDISRKLSRLLGSSDLITFLTLATLIRDFEEGYLVSVMYAVNGDRILTCMDGGDTEASTPFLVVDYSSGLQSSWRADPEFYESLDQLDAVESVRIRE